MPSSATTIALDVGTKRIGVAIADGTVTIAVPHGWIDVDGHEVAAVHQLIKSQNASRLVVGYPRNQSGEATDQTRFVEQFVALLGELDIPISYQDESLTSVLAEAQLQTIGQPYEKGDIDAKAAALILQDYLESTHA